VEMTSEKVSIIMPSHMNNEIPIQNTESKYIIEMNKHLLEKDAQLNIELQEVKVERDLFEDEVDKHEKSTQYMRGLLKNFVEINETNKKIEAEYKKHIKAQEIEINLFKMYLIVGSLSTMILSMYFAYACIGIFVSGIAGYWSYHSQTPGIHMKNTKNYKRNIKKIEDACDFLNEYIDNL